MSKKAQRKLRRDTKHRAKINTEGHYDGEGDSLYISFGINDVGVETEELEGKHGEIILLDRDAETGNIIGLEIVDWLKLRS